MTAKIRILALMAAILRSSFGAFAQELVQGERRDLTESVLESEFFDTYMERLEAQYDDFRVWFPEDRLNTATTMTFIEYQDGVVFVCFSLVSDFYRMGDKPTRVEIDGPAVVFPVFPDEGRSKFKNNRYLGVKQTADWSKRDRHFWDQGIRVVFIGGTGGHGAIRGVRQFSIRDQLIGEVKLDDDGRDTRMTDRQRLARLMGVYVPGPH